MAKKNRNRAVTAPAAPAPTLTLDTGDRLIRQDGSYLSVVANATIEGVQHVIVQDHTADGSRALHPQSNKISAGHAPMPLSEIKQRIAAGEFALGHAPA